MTSGARTVRILFGSAGRRTYLLQWFRESITRLGLRAEIAITESDPLATAAAYADALHLVPRYEDPDYPTAMISVFERVRPDLFLSLNDHELTCLAGPVAEKLRGHGGVVLSLAADRQQVVADKFAMASTFAEFGIACPATVLASDELGVDALAASWPSLVIKDRYGSNSSGFDKVPSGAIRSALASRCGPGGRQIADQVVVQPFLAGTEYGLDIASDLADSRHVSGVLARRKDLVRAMVTTRVVTVDASRFRPLAERIARVVRPQGLIDIDLVETAEAGLQVLDVNPRFGGGYPFSHVAGADVPGYFVAQLLGIDAPLGWNTYRVGLAIGRHDCFVPIE